MIQLNKHPSGGMVVITQDGGAGSSGKGSLNAWLADRYGFHIATNNFATNAGHFVELDNGTRILNQHICSAFVNPDTQIHINAGASIDLEVLFNEIDAIERAGFGITDRLSIHPLANVITNEDREEEKRTIKSGSTFKGCGAALARKAMRRPHTKLAKDYDTLRPFIKDRTQEINDGIARGMRVLIEGSQGVDLDINFAEYPFVTARQTHPTQLAADAGIPCQAVSNVIINLRTNPIRINNQSAANPQEQCYTGNYWDAREISWEDVARQAGYDDYAQFLREYEFALYTSVTKKLRRVFEFPIGRMRYIHALVGGQLPHSNVLYSLNFVNFVDKNVRGARTVGDVMTSKVRAWLYKNLYPVIGYDRLKWIRTGPRHSEIVELDAAPQHEGINDIGFSIPRVLG
jgi:hypothetical protein